MTAQFALRGVCKHGIGIIVGILLELYQIRKRFCGPTVCPIQNGMVISDLNSTQTVPVWRERVGRFTVEQTSRRNFCNQNVVNGECNSVYNKSTSYKNLNYYSILNWIITVNHQTQKSLFFLIGRINVPEITCKLFTSSPYEYYYY